MLQRLRQVFGFESRRDRFRPRFRPAIERLEDRLAPAALPPALTGAGAATFQVGTTGRFTVTTTGSPAPALSETGTLPAGVTFTDNGNGTATLAGTPPAGTGGTFPFTITATNGHAPDATRTFTLTVNEPPTITSPAGATFQVGTRDTFTVGTAHHFPAHVSLSKTGALPAGVTFTDNHDGTATLAGRPRAGTGGAWTLILTADNGVAPDATQVFTLLVDEAPKLTTTGDTRFLVGTAGLLTVTTAHGFPAPPVLSVTGALPAGLTFTDHGDGTATLTGTPATGSGGAYTVTFIAHNGVARDVHRTIRLRVDEAPTITSTAATTFTALMRSTFTVTTGHDFPAATTLSKRGTLPAGVTFIDNHDGTATLVGKPRAGTGGIWTLLLIAHNGVGLDATQTFTLTVDEAPKITSARATAFTVGTPGRFVVTTGHSYPAAVTLGETGPLPRGVSLTDNHNGTATLAGTPGAGSGGTWTFALTAHNGVMPDATLTFTLTVSEAPTITSPGAATFQAGSPGSFTVTTGYDFPTVTTLSATGPLPHGVTFVDNRDGTATLAGTPRAGTGGTYTLMIAAGNGVAPGATQSLTLTVDEAPTITSAGAATFQVGSAGAFTVTTGHEFPTIPTLSVSGPLPAGMTFTDNRDGTATLAGTPTATGSVSFTITAANGTAPNATQVFHFTATAPSVTLMPTLAPAQVGAAYDQTITASGGTAPYHNFTVTSGALPPGLGLDATGALSGTPTADGTFRFTVRATDSSTGTGPFSASKSYKLTVAPPVVVVSPATLPAAQVGLAFSQALTAGGGTAPYHFGILGHPPAGLTFDLSTGTLSGTPQAPGTFTFVITASDSSTGSGPFGVSQGYTLTVRPGNAAHVTFLSQPGNAAMNALLAPFQVVVTDEFGNPTSGTVSLTLVRVGNGGSVGFSAGSVIQVNAVNGVATFSSVAIAARGRYKLQANDGSVDVLSDPFDVS